MRIAFLVISLVLLAGVVIGREKPVQEVIEQRSAARDFDLARLERAPEEAPAADPFARRSFGAAEPQVQGAPARAEAPLLPFRYMGKVIEDGKVEILLLRGAEQYAAAPGDKLGPDYRLDKVSGTTLTFTYLPLKTKQTLDLPK